MTTSTLVMSKPVSKLGADLQKLTYAFLEKLTTDDAAPGLHIEPIKNARDQRVRTGRVNQQYRAVLFKLDGAGGTVSSNPIYVFVGVWNHDDAIARAKKSELALNPINGITEIRMIEEAIAEAPSGVRATTSVRQPSDRPPVLGYTASELTQQLGIEALLAEKAAEATSEDALLDLAAQAYEWQGVALLDLAAGVSLAEVKDKLAIKPAAPAPELTEDVRLAEGLKHPAAQLTFAYIEDNDELRRVIEGGDFEAWRVFLHPEQRAYAQRDFNGPYRLSGGAGTGKTVVLLHRARRLARTNPAARVLLTTFTTNLAHELANSLRRLDPDLPQATSPTSSGVSIMGIDALASAVLRDAGTDLGPDREALLGSREAGVTGRTDATLAWRAAIDSAGADLPAPLRSPAFFEAEYAMVVLPNRINDRESYLRIRRPGRGVRLSRPQRIVVWSVIESYRIAARAAGTIDFGEAAALAALHLDRLAAQQDSRWFSHVLVDEGQDLSPAQWQLVRALVADGPNDVFIAEDSHQRIYGHRLTLSQFGLRIAGRSRRLTLNYRTTAQNLAYARRILDSDAYVDLEDAPEDTSGYRSARTGPKPTLVGCPSLTEELDHAASLVRRWVAEADAEGSPRGTIAVLVRDRFQRDRVVSGLAERGVTVRGVEREKAPSGEPVVMTMHRAKGTEFYRVLLFGVSEASLPKGLADYHYSADEQADALLRERSLLYVAATRARDELVVSWAKRPSKLLPEPAAREGCRQAC